uniref:Uncharacterized protein n=1 Tax=Pseudomonas syringae pv. maculicola str. M6 TaxID=698750 RepID=Q93TE9_PSEYM|nr:unknown [Pseudomonas syringae pv. maculicola str. M6]
MVDSSGVQLIYDALELLGGFVAFQADHLPMPTVFVLVRNVGTAIVFREAVEAVSHNEFVVFSVCLEDYQVRRQVAEIVFNSIMLERFPLLDRVDVKFSQAQSSSMWVKPRFYTKTLTWDEKTSQPHNLTTSQPHNLTTSQPHNLTTSQPHNLTTSQPHNLTTSQPHNLTTSQPHNLTTSQPHNLTTSQPHNLTTSQPHNLTTSQPHNLTTA